MDTVWTQSGRRHPHSRILGASGTCHARFVGLSTPIVDQKEWAPSRVDTLAQVACVDTAVAHCGHRQQMLEGELAVCAERAESTERASAMWSEELRSLPRLRADCERCSSALEAAPVPWGEGARGGGGALWQLHRLHLRCAEPV